MDSISIDLLYSSKRWVAVALLAAFWLWESWFPFLGHRRARLRHATRNLALAVVNTVVLAVTFGLATVAVAHWTQSRQLGLLGAIDLAGPLQLVLGLVFLDAWMYVWHRANHRIPLLWRFHRMHHSDPEVDVTTATRFHLGEHAGASLLRLGLIPLLGIDLATILLYEALLVAITQFHHADISLGRFDRPLRWLIVTPYMHKVHHSDLRPETDSNYASFLSVWDRLGGTFRMRRDPKTIRFGLEEFRDPSWQSWWGLWKTPFVRPSPGRTEKAAADTPPQAQSSPFQLSSPFSGFLAFSRSQSRSSRSSSSDC